MVFLVMPFLSGEWSTTGLHWDLHGLSGVREALVWLYVMAWTSFGVEVCATFAPEYKDTVRDTSRALRAGVLFSLGVSCCRWPSPGTWASRRSARNRPRSTSARSRNSSAGQAG
ncbi:hypothetical protein ACFWOJ_26700 [Streptomyces sp. NPDC058439]|uniref:hypothetical protein n=1 Tax=Streptomyces sp. NPDC058439 TaxID=3346500 RepID=UPI003658F460